MSWLGEAEPLVTAIIPVFNGERFLRDAVASVLDQTYERIECIVVDDGSTDRSRSIAESYGGVRCISKPNGGVSSARNVGASEARGSLLAFLDADDVWLPEKTERQLRILSTDPSIGLLYCGMRSVDAELRPLEELAAPSPAEALRNSLLLQPPVMSVAQTAIIPAAVFAALGGFDQALSTSADTDLACRVALRHPVAGVDEPLVLYRRHEGQMHLNDAAMEHDMVLVFEKLFNDSSATQIAQYRRRAYGNLFATLAGARLARGDRPAFVRYMLRAALYSPRSVAAVAAARCRRVGGVRQ